MSQFTIPDYFAHFTADYWGEEGAAWVRDLPALLAEVAARWRLQPLPPFAGLTYNYVAPVTCADGSPAVLKAGLPREELETEIETLRLYDGSGLAQLLEADPSRGVFLIERALPGEPLTRVDDDDAATAIGAEMMREVTRPVPPGATYPTVAGWLEAFARVRAMYGGGAGPIPTATLARAEGLARDLLASAPESRLLHGDLHHDNIVSAQRQPWLVIDPKGITGDPGFEVGAFLCNPYGRMETWPNPARMMARRVDILAERLGLPRGRVVAWGYVQATLSAAWHVEDENDGRWGPALARAEVMGALL